METDEGSLKEAQSFAEPDAELETDDLLDIDSLLVANSVLLRLASDPPRRRGIGGGGSLLSVDV
jgi:hypothetical protein